MFHLQRKKTVLSESYFETILSFDSKNEMKIFSKNFSRINGENLHFSLATVYLRKKSQNDAFSITDEYMSDAFLLDDREIEMAIDIVMSKRFLLANGKKTRQIKALGHHDKRFLFDSNQFFFLIFQKKLNIKRRT